MSMLKAKIKDLPASPGIYQFLDSEGGILYIGKAKNLRNRVKSYFAAEIGRGPGIDIMVSEACDLRFVETDSEIEAVILEADLIGKLKPKYNIRLKDDKSFLMIKITKDDFPKVELVRYKNIDLHDKTAWYFGPYPSGDYLKRSLRYLRRIFPFMDCTKAKFNRYNKMGRACLYGDLGICPAPCIDQEHKADYNQNITYLKNFLRGQKKEIIKKIQKDMVAASKNLQFEKAAILRNRIRALEHIGEVAIGLKDDFTSPAKLIFPRIECYDISNISGCYAVGSMVVFADAIPSKNDYRKFRIRNKESGITNYAVEGDAGKMSEVLERRFNNDWPLPDLLIVDGGAVHLNLAKKIIESRGLNIPIIAIAKGPKRDKDEFHYSDHALAEYIHKNTELQKICLQARDESHRFARNYYQKLHSKGMLE